MAQEKKKQDEQKKKEEMHQAAVTSFVTFIFVLALLTIFTICVVVNKVREDKKILPDLVFKAEEKKKGYAINKSVSLIGDDEEDKGPNRYSLNWFALRPAYIHRDMIK